MIVGLSGYARSGKDAFAEFLVQDHGYTRLAFADKLRDCLYALNPLVGYEGEPFEGGLVEVGVQMVIDRWGWGGYKETEHGPEIRRLLQRLGTEVGRDLLGDNIWVDATLKDLDPEGKYVVTDMRFPNEYDAIFARDGVVVRITRPGVGPANDHPSETSLDNHWFEYELINDGTLEEFRELTKEIV